MNNPLNTNDLQILNAFFIPQALDGAMKQYKALSPETAAMFFSIDKETNKILCMSTSPKVSKQYC